MFSSDAMAFRRVGRTMVVVDYRQPQDQLAPADRRVSDPGVPGGARV
jgi:hypothetical protein